MPQNVLLHFPLVDLVCLQQSVREHTRRVLKFIHEHNEYLSKCKVFTSDKELAPFPLYLTEISNQSTCLEDVLLGEDDIFGVATERNLTENDCTVRSDVIDGKSDSVINRVRLFELNSLYKGIASDLKWRNSEEDFGNLTTLSCPIRFPSEEKPTFFPVPGFETSVAPPKALSHDNKNIEKKYSEFLCELGNDVQKIKSFSSSVIKRVKEEQCDSKMESSNGVEGPEDEIEVIEVKKDKVIEIITIDDDEDDCTPREEHSAKQNSSISKPLKTAAEVSESLRIPPRDLTPPSLTPEVSEPPCLLPEIMEPSLTPESSQPPLIFPEIDPPLWTFRGSSPVIPPEDVQPPVLTPEVKDLVLASETETPVLLVSDESQPSMMSSEILTPMLSNPETSNCSTLPREMSSNMLITIDSSTSESSRESVTVMDSHQESVPRMASCLQAIAKIISPPQVEKSTNDITSRQQSELPPSYSEAVEQIMITPKKTNDITKIKGWKRKQFFMENNSNRKEKNKTREKTQNSTEEGRMMLDIEDDEESMAGEQNAFVCDSLDKFLEGEVDLNINYEVPHLYAEVGIKLTKDAVASGPNVSEEELKQVESKYCIPVNLDEEPTKSSESEPKGRRGVKRKFKQGYFSSKARKLATSRKSTRSDRGKGAGKTSQSPKPKQTKVTSQRTISNLIGAKDFNGKAFNGHGSSKVLGLALYPGPNAPLPQIVQRHLDNIRSYRKTVDRNWANFALSALVVPKRNKYGRMILPVQYSIENWSGLKQSANVPTEVNEVVTELMNTVCNEASQQSSEEVLLVSDNSNLESKIRLEEPERIFRKRQRTDQKTDKRDTNVKDCEIIMSKVNKPREPSQVWCMEHDRYDCNPCGLDHVTRGEGVDEGDEPEFFLMSTPLASDKDIASLLTQKLRNSHWKNIAIDNINVLKAVVPNGLEFIKMSLVRESFRKKHIYIWYLLPHPNLRNKSRAFLTFTKTSPVPYAIRLWPVSTKHEEMAPKIVKDIVSIDKRTCENDYVIMHCNGKVWEFHGSLRYATRNSSPEYLGEECLKREEVFLPTYPPELERLSLAATKVIKEPSARWWVVDLTQKFTAIVSENNSVTKKTIFNHLRMRFCGFLTFNKSSNRVLWVYILPKMLPYVLIGPYKHSESHGLILKQGLKTIPFSYCANLCSTPNFPLKDFINSVISQVKDQEREMKGLWLCDRQQVDQTCYLEIITSSKENNFSMLEYDVDVEHGYSLKSLINSPPLKELKRTFPENAPKVMVYLYFDFIDLGYVTGHLLQDHSVIARNPLNNRPVNIPSYGFGNWFITLLKEKIRFVPSTLKLKCFVTKHFEELKERQPFDVRYLRGAYMLCEVGPDGVLKLINTNTKENAEKRVTEKSSCEKTKKAEVAQLRQLECILYGSTNCVGKINMERILNKAVKKIKELESLQSEMYATSKKLGSERIELGLTYIYLLESHNIDVADKFLAFGSNKRLFVERKSNDIEIPLKAALLRCKFGRVYLILTGETALVEAYRKEVMGEEELKKIEFDNKRGKKRSVIKTPGVMGSGDKRRENSKATKDAEEKTKETSTIIAIATSAKSPEVIETVDNDPPTITLPFPICHDHDYVPSVRQNSIPHPQLTKTTKPVAGQSNPRSRPKKPNPAKRTYKTRTSKKMPKTKSALTLFQWVELLKRVGKRKVTVIGVQSSVSKTSAHEQPVSNLNNLLKVAKAFKSNPNSILRYPVQKKPSVISQRKPEVRESENQTEIRTPNNSEDGGNIRLKEVLLFNPEKGYFVTYQLVDVIPKNTDSKQT